MPLSDSLRIALADHFDVDASLVVLDGEDVSVNGTSLGDLGIGPLQPLLDGHAIVTKDDLSVVVDDGFKQISIRRVVLRDQNEQGIIEVISGKAWLFLGDFGEGTAVNLSACSSFLLAVACLPPLRGEAGSRDWASVLERWGPVLVSTCEIPEPALAEVGCFCARNAPGLISFDPPSQVKEFQTDPNISNEAIRAYVLALEAQDGPDVTIHRLYRIFELEFAATLKADIAATPLNKLYEKIKSLQSVNEQKTLEMTVAKSNVSFTEFSTTDFYSLFGSGHRPARDSYRPISSWLNGRSAYPPDECRAHIVYYVRNALVHSKFSETDQFLFGPYEGSRAEALLHLARDMQKLIRDLLTV